MFRSLLFSKNRIFICRCGGIGRRKGLKIPRFNDRAGSSPASGTKKRIALLGYPFFVYFDHLDGLEGGSHFAEAKCFAVSTVLPHTSPRQRRQLLIVERGVSAKGTSPASGTKKG